MEQACYCLFIIGHLKYLEVDIQYICHYSCLFSVFCVPSVNGYISAQGENSMGRGPTAKSAAPPTGNLATIGHKPELRVLIPPSCKISPALVRSITFIHSTVKEIQIFFVHCISATQYIITEP